jgi:nucleotide-binding universal stress UspA family protein
VDEQQEVVEKARLAVLGIHLERLILEKITVHAVVRSGPPAETIIDYVGDRYVDLIVMCSHGHSELRRWGLDCAADKVLGGADVPVLLVRTHPQQENYESR